MARRTSPDTAEGNFTVEERAAMKDRAAEVRTAARRGAKLDKAEKAAEEAQAVVDKIAELEGDDRELAERLHALIQDAAPELAPKLWYGMPAYAKDGRNICFFQPATKFKSRYATLGFSDEANLDDGNLWPSSYALTKLTKAAEARIAALVKQAVS
jgi:uncharacterized protein YdhG (YjbR/CyaY superfamily)